MSFSQFVAYCTRCCSSGRFSPIMEGATASMSEQKRMLHDWEQRWVLLLHHLHTSISLKPMHLLKSEEEIYHILLVLVLDLFGLAACFCLSSRSCFHRLVNNNMLGLGFRLRFHWHWQSVAHVRAGGRRLWIPSKRRNQKWWDGRAACFAMHNRFHELVQTIDPLLNF